MTETKKTLRALLAVIAVAALGVACAVDGDPDGLVSDVTFHEVGVLTDSTDEPEDVVTSTDTGEPEDVAVEDIGDDVEEPGDAEEPGDVGDVEEPGDTVEDVQTDTGEECDCGEELLCFAYSCNEDGECESAAYDDFEQIASEGLLEPPPFDLEDVNEESTTYGSHFALSDFADTTLVMLFHTGHCTECFEHGQGARMIWSQFEDDDSVQIVTINRISDDDPDAVDAYVNAYATVAGDGAPLADYPAPTRWPVLQDTTEWNVYERYCADNLFVFIIGSDGFVHHVSKPTLKDSRQIQEFIDDELLPIVNL